MGGAPETSEPRGAQGPGTGHRSDLPRGGGGWSDTGPRVVDARSPA